MSTMPTIYFHPEYMLMREEVDNVNTAILGAPFVKAKREKLLPHPSSIDTKSPEAVMRYDAYLAGAEFDEFPKQTLKTIIGRMKLNSLSVELPDRISYLTENIDNDGTSLVGAIENAAGKIAAFKWQCVVTDYRGLSGVRLDEVSKADVAAANPRASVKQYPRSSVVWWHHERIDDAMQLVFIMLRETQLDFNRHTFLGTIVESFIILALDEDGNYYQQKVVKSLDGYEIGDPDYVMVGGQALRWLPVEIIADEELTPGEFPKDLGMLAPICDLALARYRVSAEYKEAMRMIAPTVNTSGWTQVGWETEFPKMNNGRGYLITGTGGVNNLPEGVIMDVISASVELNGYEKYFEANEAKVRALGGSFPTDQGKEQTATEANIGNAEQTARLVTLAYQLESGFKRAILYAGMFEGLWSPDAIEENLEQIELTLNKEFAENKLTDAQVTAILNIRMTGIYPDSEIVKMLVQGGWSVSKAEELLSQIDSGDE